MNPGIAQIKEWILEKHPDVTDIPPDLDLIEDRLIDSLRFIEFVILLERLSDQPVDLETVDIDDLRTLARIERRFFAAAATS
jgi:acyl carrier protein